MSRRLRRGSVLARTLGSLILGLLLLPGCQPGRPLEEAGVRLTPPEGWSAAETSAYVVPGTPLAAWEGPDGSSLVVFKTLEQPGAAAEKILTEYTNRLETLPGVKIVSRGLHEVGEGLEAARVVAVAEGTGSAFAPSGSGKPVAPKGQKLVPTMRVAIAIPRDHDVLWLTWHFPESAKDKLSPDVERTLETLEIDPETRTSSSS